MTYKANIEYDAVKNERILILPDELCAEMSLKIGDEFVFWSTGDAIVMKKCEKRLYRVVLEHSFKLHILVEASNEDEAEEIAKETDDYHQVHEGFKTHVVEEITRQHAKNLVSCSDNKHMTEDPYFDRLIGRK